MWLIVLFWVFVGLTIYPFIIYPGVLWVYTGLFGKRPIMGETRLTVSLIIPCWNEEDLIERRLDNINEQDYPADLIEIVIASDGSSDSTNEIVARRAEDDPRIRLLDLQRGGQTAALDSGVQAATNDVVVITDAGTVFAEDTLSKLMSYFADDEVDCVVGAWTVVPLEEAPHNRGERAYRGFEDRLRSLEARAGIAFHGQGACTGFRREVYPRLPASIAADLGAGLSIAVKGGKIVEALDLGVRDYMDGATQDQLRSRRRRVVRGMAAIRYNGKAMNPLHRCGLAFAVWSHKILRWMTGFWMLGALITNAGLFFAYDIPLYDGLFYAQVAFYALALIGFLFDGTRVARFPLLALPMSVCVVAVAFSRGFLEVLAGTKEDLWTPVGVKTAGE
jgi:glycosyltransferase involved in cell wall biosynthesis